MPGYRIPGYFLNTEYRDEKCHTAQHYNRLLNLVKVESWVWRISPKFHSPCKSILILKTLTSDLRDTLE